MTCTVCANPQVSAIDALLGSGTSIRAVSRMFGHSRSAVARHRQHAQVSGSRLALIRGQGGPGGTGGPMMDPLAEALGLSARARTDRELLKAAEAVRSATALQVRALRGGELDADMLEQLEENIVKAAALYRRVGGFENELRALAGHREAVRQRLQIVRAESVEVPVVIKTEDGNEVAGGGTWRPTLAEYFNGVPRRFHDAERYTVQRIIHLQWPAAGTSERPSEDVRVYEAGSDVLVWAKDTTS